MSRYVEDDRSVIEDLFLTFSLFLAEIHGTCAYPEIHDEYGYFSTALYLYSKYNVTVSHLSSQHGMHFARGM